MYIAISGNIGSGKTSLTEMLAERLGWKAYYEDVSNPYLDDFYQDMKRWSFNLQMCFLSKKIEQVLAIVQDKSDVIQDRTIFEEAYIFVANLQGMGLMSKRDYDTYMEFFNLFTQIIRKPDLVVYLKSSVPTLISQIQKRGREFELGIQPEYLERLNRLYDHWVEKEYEGRVLVVDVDRYDFVLHGEAFETIVRQVRQEITRLKK